MADRIFIDTNILVYSRDEGSPFFNKVTDALKGLLLNNVSLCIHRQVLREYASVVTRPAPKGLGADSVRALKEVAEFESAYTVLPDAENTWPMWKHLVKSGSVTGLRLHDAYIAAAMITNGISAILTLNTEDFKNFQEIMPVAPDNWHIIVNIADE